MTAPFTLAHLRVGESAVVIGYTDGPIARRRFVDMGLVPGSRITRLRTAPFGDPSEYAVFGARVSVRRKDAAILLVEPIE